MSSQKLLKTVAVIPARYASTRLEAKLLKSLAGKSVLQRTYEQVLQAKLIDEVVIATDDGRIYEHAKSFATRVEMTSEDHCSGTDRIAELAQKNQDWSIVINVQGDEPFINPADIDRAVEPFQYDPDIEMLSLYHETFDINEIINPNNVKLITDINNNALYFSRAVIPFARDYQDFKSAALEVEKNHHDNKEPFHNYSSLAKHLQFLQDDKKPSPYKKHIGLYAYRRETLLAICKLPASELEIIEKLEQLRALANQIKIKMIRVDSAPIGIDTLEDFKKAEALLLA